MTKNRRGIKNGRESCDSIPVYERELIPILFEVFRDTMEEYERMYLTMLSDGNAEKKAEAVQAGIE